MGDGVDGDPLAAQYELLRGRVRALVSVEGVDLAAVVPACPAWTVHDLVAHLTGLCQDWADANFDGYASEEWTQAQVDRFRGVPTAAVLDAWDEAYARFVLLTESPLPGTPSRWAFGDGLTHEADLRGAVAPGTRVPDAALVPFLELSMPVWADLVRRSDLPALLVDAPGWDGWVLGEPGDLAPVRVVMPAYEVFRARTGRRSRAQVAAFEWSGDPVPYLDLGLPYPFRWSDQPLTD